MSLISLIDNSQTDKNTLHSYLETYESILNSKKNTAKNVLEIGISTGGSIKLWNQYFNNATIYGVDINPASVIEVPEIIGNSNIKLFSSTDGYDTDFFNKTFLNKVLFDVVIDDGPHTLNSMQSCISLYSNVLSDDGILIIEDIQSIDWIHILKQSVPNDLIDCVQVYDLRKNKNRYDDILFVINKSLKH